MKPHVEKGFNWGDWVLVAKTVSFCTVYPQREMTRSPHKDLVGRVIGVTFKSEGRVIDEGEDGRYFESSATHRLIKVAVSWRSIVLALAEDLALIDDDILPFQRGYRWTAKDRAEMRDAAAGIPRDAKGRFLP